MNSVWSGYPFNRYPALNVQYPWEHLLDKKIQEHFERSSFFINAILPFSRKCRQFLPIFQRQHVGTAIKKVERTNTLKDLFYLKKNFFQ